MILEHQWLLQIVFLIRWYSDVNGVPFDLDMILNEHAIVNDRQIRWCDHGSIFGETRSAEQNVIAFCHSPGLRLAFTSGMYCL